MKITCWLSIIIQNQCNAIFYHAIYKSVTMRETLTGQIRQENNPANLLVKVITVHKRKHFVSLVLYDMYDGDT